VSGINQNAIRITVNSKRYRNSETFMIQIIKERERI
jgi:hypothetical protein